MKADTELEYSTPKVLDHILAARKISAEFLKQIRIVDESGVMIRHLNSLRRYSQG